MIGIGTANPNDPLDHARFQTLRVNRNVDRNRRFCADLPLILRKGKPGIFILTTNLLYLIQNKIVLIASVMMPKGNVAGGKGVWAKVYGILAPRANGKSPGKDLLGKGVG